MSATSHIGDRDLSRMADGELSVARASEIHLHVDACEACRQRLSEFQSTAGAVNSIHREVLDGQLPPISISRANLRTRIAQLNSAPPPNRAWWTGFELSSAMQAAAVVLGMVLLTVATAKFLRPVGLDSTPGETETRLDRAAIPDSALTPGAVRNVSLAEVCAMPHEEVELDVPSSVRDAVFQEYGISNAPRADYEIDYLIAPGLGGSEDIHNLWPETLRSEKWNAHVKDGLEEYLHQSVCSGKIDLRTAQTDISTNWISAYKKYFHTEQPLSTSASRALVPHFVAFVPLPRFARFARL
jgi:anti-sigma factor RsiW